jgi:uncharacterized protein YkwD
MRFHYKAVDLVVLLAMSQTTANAAEPDLLAVGKLTVEKTNAFRHEHGLAKVQPNEKLTATAQYFADYLARTDKFSHEADGKQPPERAKEHGYDYCLIDENIAWEFSSEGFQTEELAGKFVEGWKASPGHRKNMLDPDVTDTGVAVAYSSANGAYYAVQMFGRPKSKSIHVQIANHTDSTIEYQVENRTFSLEPQAIMTHELCRPDEFAFRWPDDSTVSHVKAKDGEKLVITQSSSGQFQVSKE